MATPRSSVPGGLLLALLLNGCADVKRSEHTNEAPSTPAPVEPFRSAEPVAGLEVDSAAVAAYIAGWDRRATDSAGFMDHYRHRRFVGGWVTDDGHLTHAGEVFLHLTSTSDSLLHGMRLHHDTTVQGLVSRAGEPGQIRLPDPLGSELALTAAFFPFAQERYEGVDADRTRSLHWFIPTHKKDASAMLEALTADSTDLAPYEPVHPQYQALRRMLRTYRALELKGGWEPVPVPKAPLHKGDSDPAVSSVRKRLTATGDIARDDRSADFDTGLEAGVKRYQVRNGMDTTGRIDEALVQEMNRPIGDRVRQIMLNMERLRWLDGHAPDDFLLVNIPEYRLHVFEGGREVWDMVVVVGKPATRTEVFSGNLSTVVLAPYWNIPQSILDKDVIPGMRRDPNYVKRLHLEVVSEHPLQVRQKPGEFNSLGLAKFLFPNSYSIYMHDTPSKGLFERPDRAFSHGCVRLKEPAKLAAYLLRDRAEWTPEAIQAAMHGGAERAIPVTRPVPVHIVYLTAWVDGQGRLNFRDDVYGRDARLAAELFVN
ncbi:MAG TPA: L,D-transpeptidase family protein [Flavobacteriales bacterium]|nr:L,D-transpeptidase family protein [Flavobacteriales bacterium]HMR26575.1 L,D-transpeptidase family protein [Flavobacteriales bacterium]